MRKYLRMDIAAYIVAGIGALILAFAGAHGFKNQSVTIISFGTGAFFVIVGGCLYWQDALWKRDATELEVASRQAAEHPYVVLSQAVCDLESMKNSEDMRIIHLVFENVGNALASDFGIMSFAFLKQREMIDAKEAPDFGPHQTPSKQPFAAHTSIAQTLDVRGLINPERIEQIRRGELIFYVRGRFTYEDRNVNPAIKHAVNFCGQYAPNTRTFQTSPFLNGPE
jgi:hypothetical protein